MILCVEHLTWVLCPHRYSVDSGRIEIYYLYLKLNIYLFFFLLIPTLLSESDTIFLGSKRVASRIITQLTVFRAALARSLTNLAVYRERKE